MSHILASLGRHRFLDSTDSMSALTNVLTGIINVLNDRLTWCFAIGKKDVAIPHSTPDLALISFTSLAHTLTF